VTAVAGVQTVARRGSSPATGQHGRWIIANTSAVAIVGVMLLGGMLRVYHLDALSLWVDEGLTVTFTRLPWTTLLGFNGVYSPHPPLYFALVKLTSYLVPELIAGRAISAVAGIATILVLYAVARRLLQPPAAVLASLCLAISPLHIWYSQEARPYALVGLLVALSYLALIATYQDGRRLWLIVYGVALSCALYADESAFFALAPQMLAHAVMVRRSRERAGRALGAVTGAAITFLPWLPHLIAVAGPVSQQSQFALTSDKVTGSLLSIAGDAADETVFSGTRLPAWYQWPQAHWAIVLAIAVTAGLGTYALARGSGLALSVTWSCCAGTIGVAAAISTLYPGYVERTVLSAVFGWTLLIGAAAIGRWRSPWLRMATRLTVAVVVTLSLVTLDAQYTDAYKQDWRSLAHDAAVAARLGWPIVTYPAVAGTLIGLYQPQLVPPQLIALADGARLPNLSGNQAHRPAAMWLAYIAGTGEEQVEDQLTAQGYVRLVHAYYPYPLYLDLYEDPDADLGHTLDIDGQFDELGSGVSGWQLPPSATIRRGDGGPNELAITATTASDQAARTAAPARPNRLYTLGLQAQVHLSSGSSRVFLICVSAGGSFLDVAPDGGGLALPAERQWQQVRIGVLCPARTDHIRVDLRQDGIGTTVFRAIALREQAATT
jgi:mannosyltransferase